MTKNEYISTLGRELKRLGVEDAGEIVGEYEQHFAFKLADGCTEEETAARLGDPASLAAQFAPGAVKKAGSGAVASAGLAFTGLFAGLFFILLFAWALVMAAFAICCAAAAVCLACGLDGFGLVPAMPYGCAAIYALALIALAVLTAAGEVYFICFVRQLMRAYARFHRNTLAVARGEAPLPPLPITPGLPALYAGRLRRTALVSLAAFAALFVLAAVVSMFSAGALEFWHVWHWWD